MMMSTGSFVIAANPGKKISLEHATHQCPRCKNPTSVQLVRSEKQLILLNKKITNNMHVRYECSNCKWKKTELPEDDITLDDIQKILERDPKPEQFTYYFSPVSSISSSASSSSSSLSYTKSPTTISS